MYMYIHIYMYTCTCNKDNDCLHDCVLPYSGFISRVENFANCTNCNPEENLANLNFARVWLRMKHVFSQSNYTHWRTIGLRKRKARNL